MWFCYIFGFGLLWFTGNLVIEPESPQLEIGRNFTATCVIVNATELTADDLYWNLSKMTVPEEQYTKINRSAVSVTITVTGERKEWLYCHSRRVSPLNQRGLTHGILLRKACTFFHLTDLSVTAHSAHVTSAVCPAYRSIEWCNTLFQV